MAGTVLEVGDSVVGPVQAQVFTHLIFQMQIYANKTLLYQCGGWAWSKAQERSAWGGKVEGATTKAHLPQASAPPGQLGEAGGGITQGSTHTLLLVTRAPNQPFQ